MIKRDGSFQFTFPWLLSIRLEYWLPGLRVRKHIHLQILITLITSDEKKLHSEISVRDEAVLDIDDHGLVQQCPVHAILLQAQSLKPGHGSLKPPKKSGKSHKSSEISKDTSKSSGSKPPKKQGKNQNSSDSSSGSNLYNDIII